MERAIMMADSPHILIFGAGPCGLCAAWKLLQEGNCQVTLIEKEQRVGGLCATYKQDGYSFDLGGHRFISSNTRLIKEIKGLLGEDLLLMPRKSAILYKDKIFKYPIEFSDIIKKVPFMEAAEIFISYLSSKLFLKNDNNSFEDWAVKCFGRKLYKRFFGPYTYKVWGVLPQHLSADWAPQRISFSGLRKTILDILLKNQKRPGYARYFFYPKAGIGQIFKVMTEDISRGRGQVLLNSIPKRLIWKKNRIFAVEIIREKTYKEVLQCDAVISTIPLPEIALLIDKNLYRQAKCLKFRGIRFLNIMVNLKNISPYTWIYVSDPKIPFSRIQEPKRRSPENAPKDRSSMILEIPCDKESDFWKMKDKDLLKICLPHLKRLGFDISPYILGFFSTRITHGYPLFTMGYREPRGQILSKINEISNLISIGRQGSFRYLFMDSAMLMGYEAARAILNGSFYDIEKKMEILDIHSTRKILEAKAVTA